ncbi:hypothetical protein PHMEG_0008525 [Phytophthora megakarya]|uniref:Uncharacterized protein n=1 Tax=Phytophthora megakarya TaxID=4795 RepID=A0A225WIK0_9STRA|nr:hypothetical protein PHMEG_0008525 [Phytophthora megakarya]
MNRNILEGLVDRHFRCKSDDTARKQAPGTGYSDPISHLAAKHDDYQAVYDTAPALQSLGISDRVTEATSGPFHDQSRQSLLRVSPFNEGCQDTDVHLHLLANVQNVYNQTLEMAIVRRTNLLPPPFVGYSSYTFNMAANKLYAEHIPILDDVNFQMRQFRHQNNYSELVTHTDIYPVKRNVPIKKVEAGEELVPTASKHSKLVKLCENLKKSNSIYKHLQKDDTDMVQVRVLLGYVKAEYPTTSRSERRLATHLSFHP